MLEKPRKWNPAGSHSGQHEVSSLFLDHHSFSEYYLWVMLLRSDRINGTVKLPIMSTAQQDREQV